MRADLERLDAPWDLQTENWDRWNSDYRSGAPDEYMIELRDEARRWVPTAGSAPKILEVGCGTGWLSADLAERGVVTGVDLSPAAIDIAKRRETNARFVCGNFAEMPFESQFDYVVSADTISHVANQLGFIRKVGEVLRPGGTFLLMTQNDFILDRGTWVQPPGPGHIRHWPSIGELRSMLAQQFTVDRESSLGRLGVVSGWLRVVRARRLWKALGLLLGPRRTKDLFGRLGLGSELVIVARRKA